MSRIGSTPVSIPDGVSITRDGTRIVIKGPKESLTVTLPRGIEAKEEDKTLVVTRASDSRRNRSLHGLVRSLLHNAVMGVTEGWTKELELHGVGYRAKLSGKNLELTVGFSHPVVVSPPEGIAFAVKGSTITVSGASKQHVGQIAANIRAVKKPEPYKGKGIRYVGEHIRKKAGKAAKAVGGGAPGA